MPADPTPADARALAEEAIRLAEQCVCGHAREAHEGHTTADGAKPSTHCAVCGTRTCWEYLCGRNGVGHNPYEIHVRTHGDTLARALLAALDEREALREQIAAEREVRDGTWWFLAAYAAGRASVIESEDFKVVRDAAEFWAALRALDALETAILQPITSAELSGRAATIRAALEALR